MGGVPLNKVQSGLGWLAGKTMPIKKNKIVVTSYYGRGFSDSPKAIVEALLDSGKELDTFNLAGGVEASPAVYENTVVVGTRQCRIWGVKMS